MTSAAQYAHVSQAIICIYFCFWLHRGRAELRAVSIQGLTRRVPPLPCPVRCSLQRLFLEFMLDIILSEAVKQASRQPKLTAGSNHLGGLD